MVRESKLAAMLCIATLCVATIAPAAAHAQSKWEIEVHGGGMPDLERAATGRGRPLPAAEAFTTGLNCTGCPASRRVSSWYFGDGAQLMNDVASRMRVSAQITPLDRLLGSALAQRFPGASVGVRVGRALNARFGAEFTFDYLSGLLKVEGPAAAAVEASRASFEQAWTQIEASGPFTQTRVTSTAVLNPGHARRLAMTGAMTMNLRTAGRVMPYLTGGGGTLRAIGDAPSATLSGAYQFTLLNVFPFSERDTVTIRSVPDTWTPVGVVGGGTRIQISNRWGVRADVRAHLSPARTRTVIDAHPETVRGTPSTFLFSNTTPSVQFSNQASPASTLSGPAVRGAETFRSTGLRLDTNLTAGVYLRF